MMLKTLVAMTLSALVVSTGAYAADLLDVYRLAQQHDQQLKKAAALQKATVQNKPLARSDLLPHLSAGASYQKQRGDGTQSYFQDNGFIKRNTTTDAANKGWSITLSQPVFHWDQWLALGQADIQAAQATVNFDIAQQNLIIRVAQAYFNVLKAEDTLQAGLANQAALAKQLQQAKKKYSVGLSAITDVQEVQAAYDQAHAQVIADKQAQIAAYDALQVITSVHVGDLQEPSAKLPLKPPSPNNAQKWVDMAIRQNLTLTASRMDAKIAAKSVSIQEAARFPTLDLQLQRSHSDNYNDSTLNGLPSPQAGLFTGNSLRLQFSLPIWSGGAISARSRQAKYQHVAAEHQVQLTARQVEQNTRDAFLGVLTGISRVKALKEAVVSAETALRATEAGLKVGTRTTVDVLNARNNLLTARTQFAQSRYQYMLSGLQLKQAAGTLDARDVARINQWLTKKPTVPGEDLKQPAQPGNPEPTAKTAK